MPDYRLVMMSAYRTTNINSENLLNYPNLAMNISLNPLIFKEWSRIKVSREYTKHMRLVFTSGIRRQKISNPNYKL